MTIMLIKSFFWIKYLLTNRTLILFDTMLLMTLDPTAMLTLYCGEISDELIIPFMTKARSKYFWKMSYFGLKGGRGYYRRLPQYLTNSTLFDFNVLNWFPTLKNYYWSPFSKWSPQYRKNSTLKMATGRNFSMSGIMSGHHNLPTYEMVLISDNVEFVRYCGNHFENGDR
jgi:hypothetical protein